MKNLPQVMVLTDKAASTKLTQSAIALGSNMGDSRATLEAALEKIDKTPGITVKAYSSWYVTAPIGPPQPSYLNGCAILEVQLSPSELLEKVLDLERKFGRVRRERWGPRTIDIDILLFADLILSTPELEIPHPRMNERAFVLVPLAEIAPDWIEPVSREAIGQLVAKLDCSGVRRLDVSDKKQKLNYKDILKVENQALWKLYV